MQGEEKKRGLLPNYRPGRQRIIVLSAALQMESKWVKSERDGNELQDIQNVYDNKRHCKETSGWMKARRAPKLQKEMW